jgi:hypothetical protein
MTVQNLIEKLSDMDKDKIVIMTEPNGIGWTNISKVVEGECDVKIIEDDNGLFHES